jgi:hypothetical protein
MAVAVVWNEGGTATIEQIDGERIQLSSSRAFAPGSRPEGTVSLGTTTAPLWMKVHGSRLQDDGFFRVHGRLLNVTRHTRERLKEAVSAPNGGKTPTS